MATALNAFMKVGKARGESMQEPFVDWIELQAWDWEVEAETSWTKGGGASVGKPSPGKMNWEHTWDRSSAVILGFICTGTAFEKIYLTMCKSTGDDARSPFFEVEMREAFITKATQTANDEGNVTQKVEMVFKSLSIRYYQQGSPPGANPGSLTVVNEFSWDIPAGKAQKGGLPGATYKP
ncbi:MAG: type VI secretion system tube protein Hcp [Caldimonas sp.]